MATTGKKVQANPSSILSSDLREHYDKHGVAGIESFIANPESLPNSSTSTSSSSSSSSSLAKGQSSEDKRNTSSSYHVNSSRFIRLNPRYDEKETLQLLSAELPGDTKPIAVPWISKKLQFYAIPSTFSLVKSNTFQSGRVYGMDISSGAAVAVLLLDDHDQFSNDKSEKPRKEMGGNEDTSFRVLDLCCAPGLKTCAIADLLSVNRHSDKKENHLKPNKNDIRIIGVDISEQRIGLCKNIITKYHIDKSTSGQIVGDESNSNLVKENDVIQPRISLYCTDGTTFGRGSMNYDTLVFDSIAAREEEEQKGTRKRMNKSARARQRKRLRNLALEEHSRNEKDVKKVKCLDSDGIGNDHGHEHEQMDVEIRFDDEETTIPLFDRVLVDAECSTDGAVRHLQLRHQKNERNNSSVVRDDYTHNHKLTDATKLANLVNLQTRLLESGFRLLKPGGSLVYSTCSLATEQNENVVSSLLQKYKEEAHIVPVMFSVEDGGNSMIYEGSLKGSVRFHPNIMKHGDMKEDDNHSLNHLFGGGFFLAKICRREKKRME